MSYIGPSIETGFRKRYVYTATAGQTSFSGNDSVGISLSYTDSEYLDVYQNGVLLVPGSDYTATTGTTVVLVTGASTDDKVEMIAYQAFGVADTVSRADGGAFGGNISTPIVTATTSVKTPLIEFTDGDDAITIADGGGVTLSSTLTGTSATFTTADNTAQLTLKSTDADASSGPVLDLVRDSASPADGDAIGQIKHIADNDAGEATTYSSAFTTLRDASDGAEDGQTINYVMTNGSLVDHLRMGRGSAGGQSEVIINEGSADIDFRVEGDGDANLLHCNAGDDRVAVGSSAYASKFSAHQSAASVNTISALNTNASFTGELIYGQTTKAANTNFRYLKFNENGGSATSLQVLGNGNVQNANNSYGSVSDNRIKQNITDANSQWDDIKSLSFKNYKEKYRVSVDGDSAPLLLGLVAQDLETAGMNGLVESMEPDSYQKETLGIKDDVKAVKYSVLYLKAVKALQEAMVRIETLESKVKTLEEG